eukprot:TRINITY_DN2562_c0_g1_i1.p1 TRINITY_DN2562_c0_g1~~TRINITY_DN2562_c0_g1_i1.p1  ORF type:complete len:202 (-),score=36.41 TRINITY_DN2562_c0_g1_i1:9-557(-)
MCIRDRGKIANKFTRTKPHICFAGLDNAGKTILRYVILAELHPNYRNLSEYKEFSIDNITYTFDDTIGYKRPQEKKELVQKADAIVFVIDASEERRFLESKEELERIVEFTAPKGIPILVFGNKIDKPESICEYDLAFLLGIPQGTTYKKIEKAQPIALFMCSAVKRRGYMEGFRWLNSELL